MTPEQINNLSSMINLLIDHTVSCEITESKKIALTITNSCKNPACDFCTVLKNTVNTIFGKDTIEEKIVSKITEKLNSLKQKTKNN